MNNEGKNWLVVLFFTGIVIFTYFYINDKESDLYNNQSYSLGDVKSVYPVIGDFNVKYTYKVGAIEYEEINSANRLDVDKIGEKFIVEFSSKDPENSKLLFNFRVCDISIASPPDG